MGKSVRGFYLVTEFIEEQLLADSNVNTVTYGAIEDIALEKQNIYPLSHMNVLNAVPQENQIVFTISVIAMDCVDVSKEAKQDIFTGNNNEQDVLNTQCAVLTKLASLIRRNRFDNGFDLVGDPTLEPFTDRFPQQVAGWVLTFDIAIANDVYLC